MLTYIFAALASHTRSFPPALYAEIWVPVGGAAFTENGIAFEAGNALPAFEAVIAA
jgi:hypothetical protein